MSLLLVLEQWAVLRSITWSNGALRQVTSACVTFVPPLQVLALLIASLVQLQQLKCDLVPTACCTQVLGLEQFSVAHDKGSSHGLSRIIRLAYHVCSPTLCFYCLLMQPDCLFCFHIRPCMATEVKGS